MNKEMKNNMKNDMKNNVLGYELVDGKQFLSMEEACSAIGITSVELLDLVEKGIVKEITSAREKHIFRERPDRFILLDMELTYNGSLSDPEFILLGVLLNNDEAWNPVKVCIQEKMKWSDGKFKPAWKGLMEKGYIRKDGNKRGVKWYVYQNPKKNPEFKSI